MVQTSEARGASRRTQVPRNLRRQGFRLWLQPLTADVMLQDIPSDVFSATTLLKNLAYDLELLGLLGVRIGMGPLEIQQQPLLVQVFPLSRSSMSLQTGLTASWDACVDPPSNVSRSPATSAIRGHRDSSSSLQQRSCCLFPYVYL